MEINRAAAVDFQVHNVPDEKWDMATVWMVMVGVVLPQGLSGSIIDGGTVHIRLEYESLMKEVRK